MTERRKGWKTKSRFSTLPSAPWKSRQRREISTFPQPRRPHLTSRIHTPKTEKNWRPWKSGNPRSGFPLFHRRKSPAAQGGKRQNNLKKGGIPPLRSTPTFRIILHWNQKSISGSFFDWNMLFRLRCVKFTERAGESACPTFLPPTRPFSPGCRSGASLGWTSPPGNAGWPEWT